MPPRPPLRLTGLAPYLRAAGAGAGVALALACVLALYAVLAGPGYLERTRAAAPGVSVPVVYADGPPPAAEPPGAHDPADFVEITPEGLALPAGRMSDGKAPFEAFRVPQPLEAEKLPRVALLVADFGLSEAASEAALEALPPGAGLAVSPYARSPGDWAARGRAAGHEAWLALPVAPADADAADPGPLALTPAMGMRPGREALHRVMGSARGYAGVAAAMDGAFSGQVPLWHTTLDEIFGRGLGFIQMHPAPAGSLPEAAPAPGVRPGPYARADIVIAPDAPADIPALLAQVEEAAQVRGRALAVVPPWPGVLERVGAWAQGLDEAGIALVPPSALMDAPARAAVRVRPAVPKVATEDRGGSHAAAEPAGH
jgi:uncharacterized protein